MVHLEQAQPEQLQELLAFAEEAFRTPEGKVDFPTLLPKLYGPGADSAPLHTVLYEDGAPAGLYCLKIQDFNIAGTALRVGGIEIEIDVGADEAGVVSPLPQGRE